MKRILMVIATYVPVLGGAQRQCRLLARELRRQGHAVEILTRGQHGAQAPKLIDGVPVRRAPVIGARHLQSVIWTLTATLWLSRHRRRFDVFQCYQLLSPAHVGILGRSDRQSVVIRPACSGPYGDVAEAQRLPLTGIRRRLLERADAFVTLTSAIEAELGEFGLGRIPCHRIPNGVDLREFEPAPVEERRALRARLGLPETRVLCVFAGRLTPQKDPGVLLKAWHLGHFADAHLVIVGEGPLRVELERAAVSGRAAGQITFVGARANVADYLRASDLLILPSRAEGMSNVLLEAMACGIPAVATDVNGNREVIGEEGQAGELVPPGDPAALAEAIDKFLGGPAFRQETGAVARSIVAERFDIRRVVTQYASLYEELQGGRERSARPRS